MFDFFDMTSVALWSEVANLKAILNRASPATDESDLFALKIHIGVLSRIASRLDGTLKSCNSKSPDKFTVKVAFQEEPLETELPCLLDKGHAGPHFNLLAGEQTWE